MYWLSEPSCSKQAAPVRRGNPEHDRYLVIEHTDRTLAFTPAVVMAAHEAALLHHPELMRQVEADRADPTRTARSRARRPRCGCSQAHPGDWARYTCRHGESVLTCTSCHLVDLSRARRAAKLVGQSTREAAQ